MSIGDRWQVQQPFPGIYVWRDPHGAFYLVDCTGTRRIPHTPAVVLELWHTPIEIDIDYAA